MSSFPEEPLNLLPSEGGGYYPASIGQKLNGGKFEIVRKLGYGPRSTTWLVVRTHDFVYFAVKIFTVAASDRAKTVELPIAKAVHKDFSQPLPAFHGSFWETSSAGSHICFLLNPMGTSVHALQRDAEHRRLPVHAVQKIVANVASVLKGLHAAGIMHGAIKADNIFFWMPSQAEFLKPVLDSEPEPTTVKVKRYTTVRSQPLTSDVKWNDKKKDIADWSMYLNNLGHAQRRDYRPEKQVDYFSAPETLLYHASCSPQTDIWMLGYMTFNLLTGKSPFQSNDRISRCIAGMRFTLEDEIPKEWFGDVKMKDYNDDAHGLFTTIEMGLANVHAFRGDEQEAAAAFIKGCLRLDPRKRFTAKECANHKWLANVNACSYFNTRRLSLSVLELAATRAFAALEADSEVIILAKGGYNSACDELRYRARLHELQIVDWDGLPGSSDPSSYTNTLEAFLDTTPNVALAIVTITLYTEPRTDRVSAERIYRIFKARNIPVNTTDVVDLSDFSFTSSHRFEHPKTGEKTPLQIGVTTNGHGCRLSARLRREIVAKLPREVGTAVEKVGRMRDLAKDPPGAFPGPLAALEDEVHEEEEIGEDNAISTPNRPVPSRTGVESAVEARRRRIKWVAQVSEYWPISKLASMSEEEMKDVLAEDNGLSLNSNANHTKTLSNDDNSNLSATQSQSSSKDPQPQPYSQPFLHFGHLSISPSAKSTKPGRILLVGSGPGHPSLLTIATHTALTQHADLVLSDKLVPAAVLNLIPKHVHVRIARKFPGNAEGAQTEMMEAAVEAAKRGLTVVRLKQGDPVVYGRAGEEVLYFRSHGFESLVIPGVSSALAAPTFAGIPVTQRGVAESFIVCTGVGRKGQEVQLPGYERSRTLLVLMGVARIRQVVDALLFDDSDVEGGDHVSATSPPDLGSDRDQGGNTLPKPSQQQKRRDGPAYPPHTPIAIIERASMPDQRVIYSTLKDIVRALESSGEQRPPGMMVIGWAVLALSGAGDMGVLDDHNVTANSGAEARVGDGGEGGDVLALGRRDRERVESWLGLGGDGRAVGWKVHEGIELGWDTL
ncbi:hypothetical protein CPB84DRAFT_1846411 [Gymnopilus junonius]|uniref:precorrin-2 dehydrogenase n=1 Tax=Gymnopilus junonius TaxID=109634 RepID=A0A9P5NSD1_GYMJU|nr:hypothetical protein CPB84DRAFT_1846411 [Gymnopilus junonius]